MKFYQSNSPVEDDVKEYLSDKLGTQVEILKSGTLGGGCINHASMLETSEGNFFLKWNGDGPADMFLREAEGLRELKKALGEYLVIPEVLAVKEIDSKPGFIVLEYLEPGNFFGGSEDKLGFGLAALHEFTSRKFGFYHNNYCGATLQNNSWKDNWASFYKENRLGFLLDLVQKERPLQSEEEKIYRRLLDRIPSLVPEKSEPVLIHGDLWSGNYMITAKGPALIDPAVCYADREMEMGIMTMFGGFSARFYDAYNERNPLSPEWKSRNKLYQLYHVLNHYYLFGGSYRHQALQIAKSYL